MLHSPHISTFVLPAFTLVRESKLCRFLKSDSKKKVTWCNICVIWSAPFTGNVSRCGDLIYTCKNGLWMYETCITLAFQQRSAYSRIARVTLALVPFMCIHTYIRSLPVVNLCQHKYYGPLYMQNSKKTRVENACISNWLTLYRSCFCFIQNHTSAHTSDF